MATFFLRLRLNKWEAGKFEVCAGDKWLRPSSARGYRRHLESICL